MGLTFDFALTLFKWMHIKWPLYLFFPKCADKRLDIVISSDLAILFSFCSLFFCWQEGIKDWGRRQTRSLCVMLA